MINIRYKIIFILVFALTSCAPLPINIFRSPAADPKPTDAIALPEVASDEGKLKVLMSIHQQLPELFSDAARFDVDLFEILEEQAELQTILRQNPRYLELWEKKQYLDFHFEIATNADNKVITTKQIKQSAVNDWRENLKNVLVKYQKADLQKEILEHINNKSKYSAGGFLNGLILNLEKDKQAAARLLQKQNDPEKLTQYLQENLSETLPNFKADAIPANPKKEVVLKKLIDLQKVEGELGPLMDAYFLTTARNEEASKLLENFDEIERQDMINLSDHDYQKPALEKLFKKDNVAASKSYQDYLNIYSSQTEVLESKIQSGYSVSIKEQNPHVAIFRGCTGGDCSSQYSFPYPNDPQERVFFIYDEQNKLKGYVSSTMVTDNNGNKALYVITISGNRVNAQDTELILQGLYQNKTALGVDEIILPESSRLGSLLNFSPIRETYTKAIKNGKNVTINYQEQMLRDKIEQYKSENNKGGYDHAKANGNGVAYTPVDKIKLKTEITKAPISKKMITVKSTFEATAVIEFCLALQDSNRSKFIEKTLDLAFDSSEKKRAAVELMNLFKSKQEFTTQEIDDYIRERAKIIGINEARLSEKKHQWFINQILKTKDGLDADNVGKNLDMIAWDFKHNNPPLINHLVFENYAPAFSEHKSFKKLQLDLLERIKLQQDFIDELEENDPRFLVLLSKDLSDELMPTPVVILKIVRKINSINVKASGKIHLALAAALKDQDADVRSGAAHVLEEIKPTDPQVHLALSSLLKDQNFNVRLRAAEVLAKIKPTDPQVLIEIYKAGDSDLNRTLGLTAEKIIALKAQLSASKNCVGSLGAFVK